jgi:hypothetical protein
MLSGCGLFGAALGRGEAREAREAQVEIITEPPGASVFDFATGTDKAIGVAPLTVPVRYDFELGRNPGFWIGWGIGTGIDGGLLGLSIYGVATSRDTAVTVLSVGGIVLAGLALVADLAVAANGFHEGPVVTNYKVVARHPDFTDITGTIEVPTVNHLVLDLTQNVSSTLTGGVVVQDLALRGFRPELVALVTGQVASELARRSNDRVLTKKDIETMLSVEKAKEALGCAELTCFADLGGMLGTRYALAGHIGRVGDYVVLDLRLIDIAEARVAGHFNQQVALTPSANEENVLLESLPGAVEALILQANSARAKPTEP